MDVKIWCSRNALFGRPLDDLPRLAGRVLACPDAVPLIGVAGARDRAFATAATLATETARAEVVARNTAMTGAAVVPEPLVATSKPVEGATPAHPKAKRLEELRTHARAGPAGRAAGRTGEVGLERTQVARTEHGVGFPRPGVRIAS